MGTREEGAAWVLVRGYSGKLRPNQSEAGSCQECGEVVYVDPQDHEAGKTTIERVSYVHLGCEPRSAPPSEFSNVIRVGGGK